MIRFVGRACRLPMANSVDAFAELLFSGTCAVTEIPKERWRPERFFHPVPGVKGKTYSFAAGVIEGAYAFDAKVFGISPREAEFMDPQQRMLLKAVWEALEDACLPPQDLAGTNVGVYVGASMTDHGNALANDPEIADGYVMTGNSLAVISNRISHVFDWHGPSITFDTACSSSFFALNAAARALNAGEIDTAIVGASNMLMSPNQFVGFASARMLSPTGLSQAFSANADGYVRGEGVVAFVLQRSDVDKSRRSLRNYGQLVHVGVNTSGSTVNIAVPSETAQESLLQAAYETSGVNPNDLAFVEAHGTGTAVGDPIEARALGRAVGQHRAAPLPIGSVKSNIGHLEPAAGAAGLLKALIALEQHRFPASLHATDLNPDIAFDDLNLQIAQAPIDFPDTGRPFYAGISSFGFGGANAHVIIAAPEPSGVVEKKQSRKKAPAREIFLTSAFCKASLAENTAHYGGQLFDATGKRNADLFDQLLFQRGDHPQRVAIVCEDQATTQKAIEAHLAGEPHPAVITASSTVRNSPPVFMFSGNGAQYAGMSLAAFEQDPAFAAAYRKIDKVWAKLSGWSLVEKLTDPHLADEMSDATIAQPLLFADQAAMVAALGKRGVTPAAVLGHSGGEVAAALSAGILTLDQALQLIYARSVAQQTLAHRGTMAALQASEQQAVEALDALPETSISIAAVNSPRSVTLVGPEAEIAAFSKNVRKEQRWACVKLRVIYPFHSAVQDEIEQEMRTSLPFLKPKRGKIPFISSVEGEILPGRDLDADYWWRNIRQPVEFQRAIRAAVDGGHRAFFEIGPDPVLTAYTRDSLGDDKGQCSISFAARRSDSAVANPVLQAVARALVNGCKTDRGCIAVAPDKAATDLWSYPWQNTVYNVVSSNTLKRLTGRNADFHTLLGFESDESANIWSNEIDIHLQPVFADHMVAHKPLLPGTAFAELALAAAQRSLGTNHVELRDLDMTSPVPLMPRSISELRTQVTLENARVGISTRSRFSTEGWRHHAAARIGKLIGGAAADTLAPDPQKRANDKDAKHLYKQAAEVGLTYGPAFQRVSHYRIVDDSLCHVMLQKTQPTGYAPGNYALDPVGVDAVFHGLVGLLEDSHYADSLTGFVPIRIGRLKLFKPGASVASGVIKVRRFGARSILADVTCFDEKGETVATLEKTRFRASQLEPQLQFETQAFEVDLQPIDPIDGSVSVLPDLVCLSDSFLTSSKAAEPDEAVLLLNAIALQIGFETASLLLQNDDPDARRTVEIPIGSSVKTRSYVTNLLEMLENADLAHCDHNGWTIAVETGLPSASDLIAGLLIERPDLVAECSALSGLARALPDLIFENLDWNTTEIFGHATLENLNHGSIFVARRCDLMTGVFANLMKTLPAGRPFRVVQLTDGAPKLLHSLAMQTRENPIEYFTASALITGSLQRWNAPCPEPVTLDPENIENAGPFDLVLSYDDTLQSAAFIDDFAGIIGNMTPGGVFAAVTQERLNYLEIIANIDDADAPGDGTSSAAIGQALGADKLQFELETLGLGSCEIKALPDHFGGASLVLATVPQRQDSTVPQEAPLGHSSVTPLHQDRSEIAEPAAQIAALPAILQQASVVLSKNGDLQLSVDHDDKADIWHVTTTINDNSPLIVFVPEPGNGDTDQVLISRLLGLADVLKTLSRPIWLIIPNGSGHIKAHRQSPPQAAVWAFMRTAKNEYPGLEIKCIDPKDQLENRVADCLASLLQRDTPETEIVLGDAGMMALRVRKGAQGVQTAKAQTGQMRAVLRDDVSGGLDALKWQLSPVEPLGATDLLVKVESTGLNYRDVMWAMSLLPEEALEAGFAGPTLGIECAGRVAAMGKDVSGFKVGDKVVTFGPGCFSSHVTIDAGWAGKLPSGISAAAAATLPVAFFTAFYALNHLGRLKADETVLIHGGAGGVGLAAIQVAQMHGARVIATAGSKVKRALLADLGVEHVLDSRSLEFVAAVERLTDGLGVDVVLNSLAGTPMEASIGLLKPFGRFLELGKLDYYANTSIGLRPLKENISYHAVDIDQFLVHDPDLSRDLFAQLMALFAAGDLTPLPLREFDGVDVVEAFRTMQRSGHIGKIVVRPPAVHDVREMAEKPPFFAEPDDLFVIVGGGGGLGLALAERYARKGATAIALIGRSENPSSEVACEIADAAQNGCEIRYYSCNVANRAELDKTLDQLRSWRPITVIVHTAMALEDMRIADLDRDVLARSLAAKVSGTRNLDLATRADPVRRFTAFTSVATLIGNHGQSAYVAANAYLEAVISQRRATGLPGLAVGFGAILDAGYLSRDKKTAGLIKRFSGGIEFTSKQALRTLDRLMANDQNITTGSVIWVSPMAWAGTVQNLKLLQGPTYQALAILGNQGGEEAEHDDLRETLASLPMVKAELRLVAFLTKEIARILRVPETELSGDRPVSEYGMDSLMGVELGLAAQKTLGDDIPLMAISDANSMKQIAGKLVAHLHGDPATQSDNSADDIAAQHVARSIPANPGGVEAAE